MVEKPNIKEDGTQMTQATSNAPTIPAGKIAALHLIRDKYGEQELSKEEKQALRQADHPKKQEQATKGEMDSKRAKHECDVLAAFHHQIARTGRQPTMVGLAQMTGLSKSTVQRAVIRLADKNKLVKRHGHYELPAKPIETPKPPTKEPPTMTTTPIQEQPKPKTTITTVTTGNGPKPSELSPHERLAAALGTVYMALAELQGVAFSTGDKVAYAFAQKMLNSELIDLKTNYAKENK